jgi:hypothetical protein
VRRSAPANFGAPLPSLGSAKGSNRQFGTTARRDAPRGNAPARLNNARRNDDAEIEETTPAPGCRADTAGRAGPDGPSHGPTDGTRNGTSATPRFGRTNPRSTEVHFGETNPSSSAVEHATEPPGDAITNPATPLQLLKLCRKLVGAPRFELGTPSPPGCYARCEFALKRSSAAAISLSSTCA